MKGNDVRREFGTISARQYLVESVAVDPSPVRQVLILEYERTSVNLVYFGALKLA